MTFICSKKTLRLNSILRDFLKGFSVLYYCTWDIIFSMNTALTVFYQPQNLRKFKYSQPPTKVAGFCKICILYFHKKTNITFSGELKLKKNIYLKTCCSHAQVLIHSNTKLLRTIDKNLYCKRIN